MKEDIEAMQIQLDSYVESVEVPKHSVSKPHAKKRHIPKVRAIAKGKPARRVEVYTSSSSSESQHEESDEGLDSGADGEIDFEAIYKEEEDKKKKSNGKKTGKKR